MNIEVVSDAGATIGESPSWVASENALYWIDVKKPALYRYDIEADTNQTWSMSSDIGAFALTHDPPGAVVALRQGIHQLAFATGTLTLLADPPFDPQLFRFNEGACDASGRFWVGSMFDPLISGAEPQKGQLHRFTRADGLQPEPDAAELHNGMAWSPDGGRFYLTHSQRREIYGFDFNVTTGGLGERRRFVGVPREDGTPDGAAVDEEGGYWCALHGAGKLRRYTAAGLIDREIDLPVSQPTMCAFAGDDLSTLYVTSSTENMDPEQRRREPLAGALLRLKPDIRGIPRRVFID